MPWQPRNGSSGGSSGPGIFYVLTLLLVFAGSTGLAKAQDAGDTIPANATAKNYGSGWRCETCLAITVPANGYLTEIASGSGWARNRGYRKAEAACIAVTVPENVHLDFSGDNWECDQPYRKRQDTCVTGELYE